jgi:hypothetical protein
MCIFVLCLIPVPLPPDKDPFVVQLNNNKNGGISRRARVLEIIYLLRELVDRLCVLVVRVLGYRSRGPSGTTEFSFSLVL